MQNEESLVTRAQQHDQAALAQLYEEYFDRIYRYVTLKIGNKVEAEDVTQQVFLKTLQSISSFKWRGISFAAWLFRVAHNQVVDYWRKRKHAALPLDDNVVIKNSDPGQIVEKKLDVEQLLLATQQLTESQREVISLRFTSGLAIAEVAKAMGKSQGAIKALQHSAIAALRKRLVVTKDAE